MKKLLLGILIILIAAIAAIYIFIPGKLTIGEVKFVNCTSTAAIRTIHNEVSWAQWWPSANDSQNSPGTENTSLYRYKGSEYKITATHDIGVDVSIQNKNYISNGRISFMSLPSDSSAIYWQSDFPNSLNPFKRLINYFEATSLKAIMGHVLDSLSAYLEQDNHIYGYSIRRTTLKDSLVLVTKATSPIYPDTKFIYSLINNLKNYINNQGASTTSYPMLNITPDEQGKYETMVAFATDKVVKTNSQFFTKFFQRNENKVLTTEVNGGINAVKKGHQAIEQYLSDHHISTPVKPFEYLITDRSLEPDSSRWVTVINYPVF